MSSSDAEYDPDKNIDNESSTIIKTPPNEVSLDQKIYNSLKAQKESMQSQSVSSTELKPLKQLDSIKPDDEVR